MERKEQSAEEALILLFLFADLRHYPFSEPWRRVHLVHRLEDCPCSSQVFKGLGAMNPPQLRETAMDPNTRRLVQLGLDDFENTREVMDMLLAKKRAGDRKQWLETKGNLAEVIA